MEWSYDEDANTVLHSLDDCEICSNWAIHAQGRGLRSFGEALAARSHAFEQAFLNNVRVEQLGESEELAALRRELEEAREWRQEQAALRQELEDTRRALEVEQRRSATILEEIQTRVEALEATYEGQVDLFANSLSNFIAWVRDDQ
jgi:uncharacterized protein YlxW (UPF0749 family)